MAWKSLRLQGVDDRGICRGGICPCLRYLTAEIIFLRVISERFYLILPDSGSVGRKDRAAYSIR